MYLSHVELGKKAEKVATWSLAVFLFASALSINTDFFPVYLYFYPLACLIIIAGAYHFLNQRLGWICGSFKETGKVSLFIYLVHPAIIFSTASILAGLFLPVAFLAVILISVVAGIIVAATYQKAAAYFKT
jgi:peptidoglycan/LPS O-acetylase OafA/YrhL